MLVLLHQNNQRMKKIAIILFSNALLLLTANSFAQTNTQTIKGVVIDKQSQATIPGVNIIIMDSNPLKGATTDMDGHFKMTDINPGRYDIKVTYLDLLPYQQ